MGKCIFGVEFEGSVVAFDRLIVFAEKPEYRAKTTISASIFGFDLKSVVVAFDRLFVFAEIFECFAKVAMSDCQFGVEFNGSTIALRRLFISFGLSVLVSLQKILFRHVNDFKFVFHVMQ